MVFTAITTFSLQINVLDIRFFFCRSSSFLFDFLYLLFSLLLLWKWISVFCFAMLALGKNTYTPHSYLVVFCFILFRFIWFRFIIFWSFICDFALFSAVSYWLHIGLLPYHVCFSLHAVFIFDFSNSDFVRIEIRARWFFFALLRTFFFFINYNSYIASRVTFIFYLYLHQFGVLKRQRFSIRAYCAWLKYNSHTLCNRYLHQREFNLYNVYNNNNNNENVR